MSQSYLQTVRTFSRNTWLYLIVNSITNLVYVGIYVMLLNLYLLRLNYGMEFIGLVNAAAQLGVAAFSIPAGNLGRRWGSRRVMIAGLVVAAVGLGLLPLVEWVPVSWQATWLLATYVFAWLGGAAYVVNGLPFLMSAAGAKERAHAFSIREALGPLALFAGSLIGGLLPGLLAAWLGGGLDDALPYRNALMLAAVLFGLAPILMLATTGVDGESGQAAISPQEIQFPAARVAAPTGLMMFIGLVVLLQLASKNVTDTFFNVYLDVGLHISPVWMGTLSAVSQLLAVPIALVTPLVVLRLGKGWAITIGTVGMAFSLALLIFITNWGGAGIGLMGVSAFFAMMNPAFLIYTQELVSPEWRGTMAGVITMASGLSRAGMAFGGGYLITSNGFSALFLAGVVLTGVAAILFWGHYWLPRRLKLGRIGAQALS